MLGNEIVITKEKHLTAKEVGEKLKPYVENPSNLHKLTLCAAILDEMSLADLCRCIAEAKNLVYFNFTATLLTPEGRNKLLNALSKNNSLKEIYLSDCLLSSVNEASLNKLIAKHPTLNLIDISGHRLQSQQALEKAIRTSQSLQSVVGCKVSDDTQVALEQNQRFAQLIGFLTKWQASPASKVILQARKQTFYKIIEKIKASTKHDQRANRFLSDFSWYLAKQYQLLGDLENATKYYEKYIECNPGDLAKQNNAHLELATLFYTSASGSKASISDTNEIDPISHQYLLMGYPHLVQAGKTAHSESEKLATAQLSKYYVTYMAEELIAAGEELLDGLQEPQSSFHRKYAKL